MSKRGRQTEVQRRRDNQRAYARKRKKIWVVNRQNGRCAICGFKRRLTLDHVIPLSAGGDNTLRNLRGICNDCRVVNDRLERVGRAR